MKIAFVSYYFPEYCIRHVNEMVDNAEVLLVMPYDVESADLYELIDPRVQFVSFPRPRFRHLLSQIRTTRQVVQTIRRFVPDVIHYQHGHMFFNMALPLLKQFPRVVTIHDAQQHVGDQESKVTPQKIMDFGYRQADHVIVHGKSLVEEVAARIGMNQEKIHYIPHTAIGQNWQMNETTGEGQTILFFGRIWEYKGLEYLIRAQPEVTEKFPDVKFVIAGQGEDFARYRQMMADPDRFDVHNDWISDEKRAELFSAASIVVLPYIEASQSGVIPVAYTHEKPVIATTTGGLPDMVDPGTTGLLVPPRDASAIADAIIQLLGNPQLARSMGAAGKAKLQRECAPKIVADQTVVVYQQAIDDCKLSGSSVGIQSRQRMSAARSSRQEVSVD